MILPDCGNFASPFELETGYSLSLGEGMIAAMQWLRKQRRYTSVVMLSLILKLIISGLHVPMSLAAAGLTTSGGTQDVSSSAQSISQFVICTPTGTKTFILDENGDPVEVPTPSNAATECGLCSLLQAGTPHLTPELITTQPPQLTSVAVHREYDAPCTPSAPQLARGQDPPKV